MNTDISRQTLGDLLRRTRLRFPNKLAIRCGSTDWTYAEFDDIVQPARQQALPTRGIEIGDRVAVISRNSHAFAALRFALARLGAVLVPINFMLNAERGALHPRSTRAPACCASTRASRSWAQGRERRHRGQRNGLASRRRPDRRRCRTDDVRRAAAERARRPQRALTGSMLAQIVYTSGTESRPKGAMLTHDAVISEYVSCLVDVEIAESDRVLHALPLYHCAQLDVFLGPCVYVGRDQRHHRQADAGQPARADGARPHQLVLRAAHGLDRAAALAAVRHHRPVVACARATTARRSCRWRC